MTVCLYSQNPAVDAETPRIGYSVSLRCCSPGEMTCCRCLGPVNLPGALPGECTHLALDSKLHELMTLVEVS